MNADVLQRAVGGISLGCGLACVSLAKPLARFFGLRRPRAGLIRAIGSRDVALGTALMLQPRSHWMLARLVADSLDFLLLAGSLSARRRRRERRAWTLLGSAAVVTADAWLWARAWAKPSVPRLRIPLPPPGSVPAESWRGSGLAEDVHPKADA